MAEEQVMNGDHGGGTTQGAYDPRQILLHAPMSTAQKVGVATTLLITAADGIDILAAAFAAPGITVEWKITHSVVGIILAANLIGLGLGALFISPLADRVGRRLTILPCLLLVAVAMLLSGFVGGAYELAGLRLLAGLGIGGMVGATLSLATEYANVKNRPLTAAVMSIGLPLGGLAGGAIASWLLIDHSWRSIFISSGIVTLGVVAIAAALLPESVEYLMSRGDARSLDKLNRVLRRFGQPTLSAFPVKSVQVAAKPEAGAGRPHAILGRELRATTLTMAAINFTQMMTIFYFISWLPQMVADMKFTSAAAASVSIYQNLFGIIGALTIGVLARTLSIVRLTLFVITGTAVAIILFALLPPDMTMLKMGAAFEGFMALGCSAGIYGLMARAFPAPARSTGIGFSYAFGRLGSIVAAIIPGLLFTKGWPFLGVAGVMATGSVIAATVLLLWHSNGGARRLAQPLA